KIPITITNSGQNLTDYQVNITIDTQSLITQGKMRSDCGDIRFFDENGNYIPYWIESGCNTTQTVIWIKVPYIPANGQTTVYMYYGNPQAESESNGTKVFEFFDDFEGTDLDTGKWTIESHTSNWGYSVENGYLKLYTNGHVCWWDSECWTTPCKNYFAIYAPYTENYLFEAEILDSNLYSSDSSHVAVIGYQDENNVYFWGPYHWTSFNWGNNKNLAEKVEDDEGKGVYGEDRTPFPMVFGIRRNGTTTYIYRNRELRDTDESTTINWDKAGFTLRDWLSPYGIYAKFDWALIRKYADPEPTVTVENEEPVINPEIKIPYWIESKRNREWAKVWIKVPEIPASSTATIYMYYGNTTPVESESNPADVFDDFNTNFEIDEAGTCGNNITDWNWRYGYSGWADNKWNNVSWGYTQAAEVTTTKCIDSSNYFDGEKSYKGYIKLKHTSFPTDRGTVMELYTEGGKRFVIPYSNFTVWTKYSYTTSSRYAFGIYVVLYSSTGLQRDIMVWRSWNNDEGCPSEISCPYDDYIATQTGNDGTMWKKYVITVNESVVDKTDITALGLRQWQDAWDLTTASNTVYWDKLENIFVRKYTDPEPSVSIGTEQSRGLYISLMTDKANYSTGEVIKLTIEVNRTQEYPQVMKFRLELEDLDEKPDTLIETSPFVMPAKFHKKVVLRFAIPESPFVSSGRYAFKAYLIEPSLGEVLAYDAVYFNVKEKEAKAKEQQSEAFAAFSLVEG
ncbi:MAG: DUF2341 domain-containing protein, partial [Methanophagales archaeon]|nr:DUF2341 domain-containing protein [Methanophagales archaeon]